MSLVPFGKHANWKQILLGSFITIYTTFEIQVIVILMHKFAKVGGCLKVDWLDGSVRISTAYLFISRATEVSLASNLHYWQWIKLGAGLCITLIGELNEVGSPIWLGDCPRISLHLNKLTRRKGTCSFE